MFFSWIYLFINYRMNINQNINKIISRTRLYMENSDKYFKNIIRKEIYKNPEYEDLLPVLYGIENACSDINKLLRKVTINELDGSQQNKINIQNETQQKIDFISNRIMKTKLCSTGKIDYIISEEENNICNCSELLQNKDFIINEKYFAVFDPLDGSSNIDTGLPTGTIFGIFKKSFDNKILLKGSSLILAGYCLYSASTQLLISFEYGNFLFMYDDHLNQFILIKKDIKIPISGPLYSFNDANKYADNIKDFLIELKKSDKKSARYMGALVADTHNILFNGGIFGYPPLINKPNGKLRLYYEAIPISFIIEKAGGIATNGTDRILDIEPTNIHQRTPLFFGSVKQMNILEKYFIKK